MAEPASRPIPLWQTRLLGGLALLFFALHGSFHATHGRPFDVLWICTLSNALLGVGLLLRNRRAVAVAVCWLVMGNATWLADVLTGGEFFGTSTLTHCGGLTVGILGARLLGWPRHTWIWATAGMLVMQQLCRLITPPAANVNLAFAVYAGWEHHYSSYRTFWLALFGQAVVVYFLVDRMFGWLLRPRLPRAATPPT